MYRKMRFLMSVVLLLGVAGNAAYSEEPDLSHLIGYWKLDDNLKTSTVVDSGVTGTQHGSLYDRHTGEPYIDWFSIKGNTCDHSVAGFEGTLNTAFYFDGIDDKVYVPAFNREFSTMTITAWIKRDGDAPTDTDVGLVYSREDVPHAFGLWFGPEQVLRYEWYGDQWKWLPAELFIPDNQWAFVAMVVEPTKATLYLNETSAVNVEDHVTIMNNAKICFGEDDIRDRRWYRGCMDEVRIYDYALSQAELRDLMGQRPIYEPVLSPSPAEMLYNMAKRYEKEGRFEDADSRYQQIIQQYPDSSYADEAQSNISKMVLNVFSLIESGDDPAAAAAIDSLIADFNDHPDLSVAVLVIGEQYYSKAFGMEKEGCDEEARNYFRKALTLWKRIIQQLPPSAATAEAHHFSARCYCHLGEYEKAIEYCRKIVDNWPDSECAGHAQFLIGDYFERLRNAGSLPEAEANGLIEQAYKAVVEKYPDCVSIKRALLQLGWLNFKTGQWAEAAECWELSLEKYPENYRRRHILYPLGRAYEEMGQLDKAAEVYNEFINTVPSFDPRIEKVKVRLEKLGITNDN